MFCVYVLINFQAHKVQEHSKYRSFNCHWCTARFSSTNALIDHRKTHKHCVLCDITFSSVQQCVKVCTCFWYYTGLEMLSLLAEFLLFCFLSAFLQSDFLLFFCFWCSLKCSRKTWNWPKMSFSWFLLVVFDWIL